MVGSACAGISLQRARTQKRRRISKLFEEASRACLRATGVEIATSTI